MVDKLKIVRETAHRQLKADKATLCAAMDAAEAAVEALHMAQAVAAEVQAAAHARVANVVTRCLAAVFDDPYQFKIHFEQKRGKTEARLVFLRDGLELDPMTAAGGGVVDVAAFALRLAALVLTRPPRRRLVVLDEPMKFLSERYRPRVRALLESLAEELDVQFIIVTHIDALQAGTVIEIGG